MELNDRARKRLAGDLAQGESIVATVGLKNAVSEGSVTSGGSVHGGATALGTRYAQGLGIDLNDPRLKGHLLYAWCTLTDTRLLFHKPSPWTVRPAPGKFIEAHPRAGVRLTWFDVETWGITSRVFHLDFPDGTRLLSATTWQAKLTGLSKRKAYNDEPVLFVQGFGDDAVQVASEE